MGANTDRFTDAMASGGVILMDGAMGTELNRRGIDTTLPLWSARALMDAPDAVVGIHRDYIDAGARLITTNTFRTSVRTLDKAGMANKAEELTRLAMELAVKARAGAAGPPGAAISEDDIFIAGSMAPMEDCYSPELAPAEELAEAEHGVMAGTLAAAGADLLLVETMNTTAEAAGAVKAAKETDLPVLVSFTLSPEGRVLGGDRLEDTVKRMEELGVSAILLNCFPARDMDGRVAELMEMTSLPAGAYANMGIPDDVEGWEAKGVLTPEEYAEHVGRWVRAGARLVGGCCGTGAEHILKLREMLDDRSG